MKKYTATLPIMTLCAAALLAVPALTRAQDNANNTPAAPPGPSAPAPASPAVPLPPSASAPPPESAPPPASAPAAATNAPVKRHVASVPSFRGTLTAVDTNAMTLTVGKRTYNMTSKTMVTKDGKPAVLADGTVGDPVRGTYKKGKKGELDAVTIHFGGPAKSQDKPASGN